jgi:hypothetical protein
VSCEDHVAPGKSTLYEYRITLDLCSMLFARTRWFSEGILTALHIRLDSSPQFGRDYLLAECDIVFILDALDLMSLALAVFCRLLVAQCVGARASNAAVKASKLLHMLALESEKLMVSVLRVHSVLCDFGTECAIWTAPSFKEGGQADDDDSQEMQYRAIETLFPNSLPIPDHDHCLHHARYLSNLITAKYVIKGLPCCV